MTLSIMTPGVIIFSTIPLSIMNLSIMTPNIIHSTL
jgi:hypothetical protein